MRLIPRIFRRDSGRALFEAQFEPRGDGFLYRRGLSAAPVAVSAAEREAFVAEFVRARRRVARWGMAVILLVAVALAALSMESGGEIPDALLYGGVVLAFAAWIPFWYRVWNAPARALARRPEVGRASTRSEARRSMAAAMPWRQIGCLFYVSLGIVAGAVANGFPRSLEGSALALLGLGAVAAFAQLAWLKWRSRRGS